jgi:Leucine-rich repeat (LRR) protein
MSNILINYSINETRIIIFNRNIKGQIELYRFKYLVKLDCSKNYITNLSGINKCNSLTTLDCSRNYIKNLDNLPECLKYLFCSSNPIISLDKLPSKIEQLNCSNCHLSRIDNLPESLKKLYCSKNDIVSIKNLPEELIELDISRNKITCLDYLPNSIVKLNCSYNKINDFNNIPNLIEEINLKYNASNKINFKNLPKNIKKILFYKYQRTNDDIIENINFNEWNIKYKLRDYHNYLEHKTVENIITFSPTDYNFELDPINCECACHRNRYYMSYCNCSC